MHSGLRVYILWTLSVIVICFGVNFMSSKISILKRSGVCTAFGLVVSLLGFAQVSAETIYTWEDSSGRLHFGGNPPSEVSDAEPIKAKSFSTYSSSKLLKGYGLGKGIKSSKKAPVGSPEDSLDNETELPAAEVPVEKVEEIASTKVEKTGEKLGNAGIESSSKAESETDENARGRLVDPGKIKAEQSKPADSFNLVNKTPNRIEIIDPSIVRDSEGQIVSCSTMLKNMEFDKSAKVRVRFGFGKKNLYATGPDVIPAGTLGFYELDNKHFPVAQPEGEAIELEVVVGQ